MSTAQDQQSREAYEDGKWYWVELEGWHGEPPTIAPACYKAECDAWYSYIFSGISTPYLKVLGPCELQAARALLAPVICYVRPGATLPRRMGWETCAATDAGALAVHADGRALPDEGLEPVAWTVAGAVTNWARDFSKYKTQHYVRPVFTAAQAQAMGRVPPGWKVTEDMHIAAVKVLHRATGVDGLPQRMVDAMLAAAPQPAAQERQPLSDEQIRTWWASENGLEDCDMGKLVDFTAVVRAVEAKLGVTGGDHGGN